MMSFGTLYWLVPRLWNRELAYPKMATQHFWLATIGIVLYTVSMWVAGLMEGLQWRAMNDAGQLVNPIFLDIVTRLMPYYWMRLLGGSPLSDRDADVPLQPPENHQGIRRRPSLNRRPAPAPAV